MKANIGYSPYMYVEDKDNHILRDKISEGELDGYATLLSLEARYNFTKYVFSTLGVDYIKIKAEGEQTQYYTGIPFAEIEEEIESDQTLTYLKVGVEF
jgi:hypothetical protein